MPIYISRQHFFVSISLYLHVYFLLHVPFILSAWKTLFLSLCFDSFFLFSDLFIWFFRCLRCGWVMHTLKSCVLFLSLFVACWIGKCKNISDTIEQRMQMKAGDERTNFYSDKINGDKYTIRDSRWNSQSYVFIIHVFLSIQYFFFSALLCALLFSSRLVEQLKCVSIAWFVLLVRSDSILFHYSLDLDSRWMCKCVRCLTVVQRNRIRDLYDCIVFSVVSKESKRNTKTNSYESKMCTLCTSTPATQTHEKKPIRESQWKKIIYTRISLLLSTWAFSQMNIYTLCVKRSDSCMVYLNETKKERRKRNNITHIWKERSEKNAVRHHANSESIHKHTTTGVSNRSRPWNKSYAYLCSRVNEYEVTIKTFIIFFSFFHNTNTYAVHIEQQQQRSYSLILFLWHFYSFCPLLRPFHVLLLEHIVKSHHTCYHILLYFLYSFNTFSALIEMSLYAFLFALLSLTCPCAWIRIARIFSIFQDSFICRRIWALLCGLINLCGALFFLNIVSHFYCAP